jgi:plasmid maintenance system antidote protein VapI
MTHIPAEVFHPSIFIKEEMEARGWTIGDLAKAMGGDYGINFVGLEFYLELGPEEPGLRMNDTAVSISRAFGIDPDFFSNLERSWLEHPSTQAAIRARLH